MKKSFALVTLLSIVILSSLACGRSTPAPTAGVGDNGNIASAVSTAAAATAAAQQALEATIAASVAGTEAASVDATATQAASAPPEEGGEMTEEELADLIDQAVAEAVLAMEETSTATTAAAGDGALDQAETQTVYVSAALADETVAYALDLIAEYEALYGELAAESLALMQELENDLEEMNTSLGGLVEALEDINASLQQGLEVATETIAQVQSKAQAAYTKALEAQTQAQAYLENLPSQMEGRVSAVLGVQPDQVPADLPGSIQAAFAYLDTTRQALSDRKVTSQELSEIAHLGANASAGLERFGGVTFASLVEAISGPQGITSQMARGQLNQAMRGLGSLESSLGNRPRGGGGGRRP
jgi:hypothetical protein